MPLVPPLPAPPGVVLAVGPPVVYFESSSQLPVQASQATSNPSASRGMTHRNSSVRAASKKKRRPTSHEVGAFGLGQRAPVR